MKPAASASQAASGLLTPVVLDALSVSDRLLPRLASLDAIDVLWVAESVREARELLLSLGPEVRVLDLSRSHEDPLLQLEAMERSGVDSFTVIVTASDAPALTSTRAAVRGAFLCRSSRIRELPKLLHEIVAAWK